MANISPVTSWVKQPITATGLDHLGSQAPCINLYGRFLPGITNVTDRARYYSFYPWFFWAYEQQYSSLVGDEIIERFRRADCLFTMIAERHAMVTDNNINNHGIAMVGRNTLVEPVQNLEDEGNLRLSKYSTQETENKDRYFKNKLGGLGQYYIGTFVELGLVDLDNKNQVPNYTLERGKIIGKAFDSGVDRQLFFKTIDNDLVNNQILDQLKSFCPCQLSLNPEEHNLLIDLFFDRNNIYDAEGKQRRHTLCLLLHLINELDKKNSDFNATTFRGAIYTGSLPDQINWAIPASLIPVQKLWQIYQRNELLSIALQGLFWMALEVLVETNPKPLTSGNLVSQLIEMDFVRDALEGRETILFADAVNILQKSLPPLENWQSPDHEIDIGQKITAIPKIRNKNEAYREIIKASLQIILLIAARDDQHSKAYSNLKYPDGYFDYYPINLNSFKSNLYDQWQGLTLKELLAWLIHKWGIETHFRVALRKLRHSKRNTFRVYPTDEGLNVHADGIPRPVFTNPRFQQAVQVLKDIEVVEKVEDTGKHQLTPLGKTILDETIGN